MIDLQVERQATPLYNARPLLPESDECSQQECRIAKVAELVDALDLGSSG